MIAFMSLNLPCLLQEYYGLGKGSIEKNVFFRALPELPKPPPDPNLGNLVLFFRTSKFNAVQVPTGSQVRK